MSIKLDLPRKRGNIHKKYSFWDPKNQSFEDVPPPSTNGVNINKLFSPGYLSELLQKVMFVQNLRKIGKIL